MNHKCIKINEYNIEQTKYSFIIDSIQNNIKLHFATKCNKPVINCRGN